MLNKTLTTAGIIIGLTIPTYKPQPEMISPYVDSQYVVSIPVEDIQDVVSDDETTPLYVFTDKPLSDVGHKKTAKITAYSCGGEMTPELKAMNCPNGITATGTTPRPYITVACPRKHLGKQFDIEGVGVVTCEDVGGAIKGQDRFDLYVDTISDAFEWGIQYREYSEV